MEAEAVLREVDKVNTQLDVKPPEREDVTGSQGRMEQVIERVASGVGETIGFLAQSGILFVVFALIWVTFGAAMVWGHGTLDTAWEWIRDLPWIAQGAVWLLFLPVMLGVVDLADVMAADLAPVAGRGDRGLEPACLSQALEIAPPRGSGRDPSRLGRPWTPSPKRTGSGSKDAAAEILWEVIMKVTVGSKGLAGRIAGTGRPRLLLGGVAVGAGMVAYLAWRPRMLRWGATDDEAGEALPGDDATPHPVFQSTRAITIDAPPERVWPWIVQMGIERAGFYSHDWLERLLFHARYVEGRHSATRIHPELQDLQVGDLVPYGGGVFVPVQEIEPFRHLVHGEAWVLRPLPGGRTRLIVRYRGAGYIAPALTALAPDAPLPLRMIGAAAKHVPGVVSLARAIDYFVGDSLHHYMEVGMLEGVKSAPKAGSSPRRSDSPRLSRGPSR